MKIRIYYKGYEFKGSRKVKTLKMIQGTLLKDTLKQLIVNCSGTTYTIKKKDILTMEKLNEDFIYV